MMNKGLFDEHTQSQHADSLAAYLPGGKLFEAKNREDTVFRRFLLGLAAELQRFEQLLIDISNDYDVRYTDSFLTNWESTVGIPDGCFTGTGTTQERINAVLFKLAAAGANTEQDFIDLAALIGFDITIEHLDEVEFYPPYDVPITLITGVPESRFIWIVKGAGVVPNVPPYDVPFGLQSGTSLLQCVFGKLKSAITEVVYTNT